MTHLADELREGLLALAVGTGLQVMDAIFEESVTALCGPKGRHDPERTARPSRPRGRLGRPRRTQGPGPPSAGARRPTARARSRSRPMSTSPRPRCSARWRWRRCSPSSRPVATHSASSPSGLRSRRRSSGKSRSAVSRRFVERDRDSTRRAVGGDLSELDLVAPHGRRRPLRRSPLRRGDGHRRHGHQAPARGRRGRHRERHGR